MPWSRPSRATRPRYSTSPSTTARTRAPPRCSNFIHVPALERTNALFASAVAYAYLVASGLKVATSPEQVRELARLVKSGEASVHDIAEELRQWTV